MQMLSECMIHMAAGQMRTCTYAEANTVTAKYNMLCQVGHFTLKLMNTQTQ